MDDTFLARAVDDALGEYASDLARSKADKWRQAILVHKYAQSIETVLKTQPEFATDLVVNSLNGATGFGARLVSSMLVRQAERRGSGTAAIDWLKKVLSTKSAVGLAVYTMRGLRVQEPVDLVDEIRIVPFDALPDSGQKQALVERLGMGSDIAAPWYLMEPPSAALIASVSIDPFVSKPDEHPPLWHGAGAALGQRFEGIRHCLAITCGSPVLPGPSWFQFEDTDLQSALLGMLTTLSHQEIVPLFMKGQTELDATAAKQTVRAYFASEAKQRQRIRTAMERVHLGLIRSSPADRMLEIAIALEALLVDSAGENTFKVSLRASLLASNELQSRVADRAIIAAAYGLRSALMHSGQSPTTCTVRGRGKMAAADVATRAVEIALAVLRRVVAMGRLPDWSALELSGVADIEDS